MNITLLILGVLLVIISIILITVNSSTTSTDKAQDKDEGKTYQPKVKKAIIDTKPIVKELVVEETLKSVDDVLREELYETEDIKEFKEEYKIEHIDTKENITEEIIKMYRDGLSSNEIAKNLDKGVREIDIILKVNNIKN